MRDDRAKWAALSRAPEHDAHDPELRALVRGLLCAAEQSGGSKGDRERVFAHLAHAISRDCIRYKTDTARMGGEDIAGYTRPWSHALEALSRGVDDCDAKARLFVALCLAAGMPARIVPHWEGTELKHVSAEVTIARTPYAVETILSRARLGDRAPEVPTERESKRWLYT